MMPFFVPIYFGSHVGDVDIGALFILFGVIGLITAALISCYDSYPSAPLTSAFQFKEEVVPEEEKRLDHDIHHVRLSGTVDDVYIIYAHIDRNCG